MTRIRDGATDSTPLVVFATRNAGVRGGARALAILVSWDAAERDLGRPLGDGEGLSAAIREYTDYWNQSERTTWRELKAFRQAFPDELSPASLAAQVRELHPDEKPAAAVVGGLVLA